MLQVATAVAGCAIPPCGLPALTLPFCSATLAFALLKDASRSFSWVPPSEVVTPEEHRHRAHKLPTSAAAAGDAGVTDDPNRG